MSTKILIIERNARIGGLISSQLNQHGYQAKDVRHGAEAAVALREELADLILVDDEVVLGGLKTARLLRLHPKYSALPLVLSLSSDKDKATVTMQEGKARGLNHFLTKPFSMPALLEKLGEALTLDEPTKQPTSMETREEIRALTDLPVMPEAHNKLLMLLNKPDREVDLSEVARTLEMDPGLSSRVMRVCKSAYFGFQGNMMKQALAFLGVEEIRRIVQSAVVYDVFREDEDKDVTRLKMRDLWKHSIGVGIAMELLGKSDKNKTHFLLGTLHDLGKAIFKFHFPIHFNAVMDMVENENMSMFEAEKELLGITHAECGGVLATHWDLPIEVRTAITSHHSPSQHPQHRQLSATVHICDIAIRTMKIGYAGDPLIPPMDLFAKRTFPEELDMLLAQKDRILQQVEAIAGDQ
ncbi:MAG: response regulator [Candidatus Latescibacterota bacterium]|nr:response regulator [Candidatus Latescibacterota bacterium]MEE2727376.1 response regulator [Candidatus Latescibacterota bacterium]